MEGFSWAKAIDRTIKTKQRRDHCLAKLADPQFQINHNKEVVAANRSKDKPDYTELDIRIKKFVEHKRDQELEKRKIRYGCRYTH